MCVLVVEDDILTRMILVEELQDAGFHVKQAATADEAVGMLESLDPPLSTLVTDIHMPGLRTGMDLALHIHRQLPDIPIIITTGRPDALRDGHIIGGNIVLVRKPYVPDEVIHRIRQAQAR